MEQVKKPRIKEFKMDSFQNFNVRYGTLNYSKKTCYIRVTAWARPLVEMDFEKEVFKMNSRVRKAIEKNINETIFHKNKFIVDFNLRKSGIKLNKSSFISFDIHLSQKSNYDIKSEEIRKNIEDLISNIICENFENKAFNFNKKKKNVLLN